MRALVLVFLVACGGKNGPKLDCDAYATKFSNTVDADPSRRASMYSVAKGDCDKNHVDQKLYDCVMKAQSNDDIMVCQGLTPPPH